MRSTDTDGLLDCPACGLPAEIVDRFTLDGSPYPVDHLKVVCLAGHWFTPPAEYPSLVKPERDGQSVDASEIGAAARARLSRLLDANER
jgi:hypothetical protein